jgi:hypothetical protein
MAKDKIKAIQEYQILKSLRDLQLFPGFAHVSRCLIFGFSKINQPVPESIQGYHTD